MDSFLGRSVSIPGSVTIQLDIAQTCCLALHAFLHKCWVPYALRQAGISQCLTVSGACYLLLTHPHVNSPVDSVGAGVGRQLRPATPLTCIVYTGPRQAQHALLVACCMQSKVEGAGSSNKEQFEKQKQEVVGESKENIKEAEDTLQVSISVQHGTLDAPFITERDCIDVPNFSSFELVRCVPRPSCKIV